MTINPRQRKCNRRKGIDYTRPGIYFVTLCTKNREAFFGEISDELMILNARGEIANRCWLDLPRHYPHSRLHRFMIMPTHVHGIIEIVYGLRHSLSEIIRGFKTFSSRMINQADPNGYFRWQRSFYDRVIRNRHELAAFEKYILDNPENWSKDEENPLIERM